MILYMNIKDLSGSRATVVGPEPRAPDIILEPFRAKYIVGRVHPGYNAQKVLLFSPGTET